VTTTALLRLVAGPMWWVLADAICSDAGIDTAVRGRSGGSFGVGRAWGRYAVEPHGIDIYRQATGDTVTVTWGQVRGIRRAASPTVLGELAAASALVKSGPTWRLPVLPYHLRPEGRDPAMTDSALRAARDAVHARWKTEVDDPFQAWRHESQARLAAAFTAVLVDEPEGPSLEQGVLDLGLVVS
jgi:hypothetical protein